MLASTYGRITAPHAINLQGQGQLTYSKMSVCRGKSIFIDSRYHNKYQFSACYPARVPRLLWKCNPGLSGDHFSIPFWCHAMFLCRKCGGQKIILFMSHKLQQLLNIQPPLLLYITIGLSLGKRLKECTPISCFISSL